MDRILDLYHFIKADRTTYDFPVSLCRGGIQSNGTHLFIHISDTEIHQLLNISLMDDTQVFYGMGNYDLV